MESNVPPKVVINQMLFGFVLTKAIHVAAKLNIADHLANEGPMTAAELARHSEADEESLSRLLRALASIGVFRLDQSGKYALTATGECLKEDGGESIKAMALITGDMLYKAYD
ncbi:MAG: hypothetical protein EOP45_14885, partial [Sphingobacteriaceae bacterium]